MKNIRQALIHLGVEDPSIRPALRPIVRSAAWESLPKGWTQESVEKFWESLTGQNKHKVTKCIKEMEGKFDDPGAFCASLADKVDPGWRSRPKEAAFGMPQLPAEETQALRIIKDVRENERKRAFFMAQLGNYGFNNPVVASLVRKGLVVTTPRTIKITPNGEKQLLWNGRLASRVAQRWLASR